MCSSSHARRGRLRPRPSNPQSISLSRSATADFSQTANGETRSIHDPAMQGVAIHGPSHAACRLGLGLLVTKRHSCTHHCISQYSLILQCPPSPLSANQSILYCTAYTQLGTSGKRSTPTRGERLRLRSSLRAALHCRTSSTRGYACYTAHDALPEWPGVVAYLYL